MRPHFLACALLLACSHTPTIERDAPRSVAQKAVCDEMLSPIAPEPQSPYVESFAWADASTVVAAITEGSGPVRSCGLDREPQRNGLAVYRVGEPSPKRVFRGLHATHVAAISGTTNLMVAGPRFGLGTVDRETGCFRRTNKSFPTSTPVAMDGKRGRFFVADQFLQVWNAKTLLRVAAIELAYPPRAIAWDATTDTVVLLSPTKNYQVDELTVFDATTLKKSGSLTFPARGYDQVLRVRPRHGEVVVMYETQCTKWPPPQPYPTKVGPRCLAGYSRGLLHVRLAPLEEIRRNSLDTPMQAVEWTPKGDTFVLCSEFPSKLSVWNPEAGTLVERSIPYRFASAVFAPDSERFVDQPTDFVAQVHSLTHDESLFDAELPHGPPSLEPPCGPGK